jgi:2-haloacid dehalogenase
MAYREILGLSLRGLCEESGFTTSEEQEVQFAQAVGNWPAFGDSTAALRRLAKRYKLGVITNCDDDLFALSNERLGVSFDWIITAQKAGSYKPSLHNFEVAFATIGLPRHRILHVAQSLYHDHVPAKQIGMTTVWVNRRHGKEGRGATPAAAATPDLMVPDMKTFADIALERPPEGTRH